MTAHVTWTRLPSWIRNQAVARGTITAFGKHVVYTYRHAEREAGRAMAGHFYVEDTSTIAMTAHGRQAV